MILTSKNNATIHECYQSCARKHRIFSHPTKFVDNNLDDVISRSFARKSLHISP